MILTCFFLAVKSFLKKIRFTLDKGIFLCYNHLNVNAVTEKKQGITAFREPSYGGRGQRRFEDTFPSRYGEI